MAERLELVEELWDSIPAENEAFELTSEQRAELDRRLAEAEANPGSGAAWELDLVPDLAVVILDVQVGLVAERAV